MSELEAMAHMLDRDKVEHMLTKLQRLRAVATRFLNEQTDQNAAALRVELNRQMGL